MFSVFFVCSGVQDIIVGARNNDDSTGRTALDIGAVYILFLSRDGTVKREQKISYQVGGFGGLLDASDAFGAAVAGIGDVNDE